MLFKFDIEKGYDHGNLKFVQCMLCRMSFGMKWRRWMKTWRRKLMISQHIFVVGRQILNVVLIANEEVDELVYRKRKTYDHVNWRFVDCMLCKMGFSMKWRRWIKTCISTISFAVLVNGGSFSFF